MIFKNIEQHAALALSMGIFTADYEHRNSDFTFLLLADSSEFQPV